MTTTDHHAPATTPVSCAPWCEDGDGHPRDVYAADQWCASTGTYVDLLDASGEADPFEQVGALARLDHNPARASVVLHVTACNADIDPHLSVSAARELARALLAAAELAEAGAR